MRASSVVFITLTVSILAAAPSRADDVTLDQCVQQYLNKPVKDWTGYDNCRRGATQLKLKGADGQGMRNLVPQTNAGPASGGSGSNGDTGSH